LQAMAEMEIKQGGSDTGHWLWFLQRLTGAGILLLLAVHWGLQHFGLLTSARDPTEFASVTGRLAHPGFQVFYVVFLLFLLFHAFHGLWMVGRDYLHAGWSRLGLAAVIVTAFIVMLVWGLIVILGAPVPV